MDVSNQLLQLIITQLIADIRYLMFGQPINFYSNRIVFKHNAWFSFFFLFRMSVIHSLGKHNFVTNKVKGRISKRVFQENKASQIFRKMNISYPLICTRSCAYQGVRNMHFFEKFGVLCFLEKLVLKFTLWLYYRRLYG